MKNLEKLIVIYWSITEWKEEMEKLWVVINNNFEEEIIDCIFDIIWFPKERFWVFSRDWLYDIVFDCKEKNIKGAKKIIKELIAFSKKI